MTAAGLAARSPWPIESPPASAAPCPRFERDPDPASYIRRYRSATSRELEIPPGRSAGGSSGTIESRSMTQNSAVPAAGAGAGPAQPVPSPAARQEPAIWWTGALPNGTRNKAGGQLEPTPATAEVKPATAASVPVELSIVARTLPTGKARARSKARGRHGSKASTVTAVSASPKKPSSLPNPQQHTGPTESRQPPAPEPGRSTHQRPSTPNGLQRPSAPEPGRTTLPDCPDSPGQAAPQQRPRIGSGNRPISSPDGPPSGSLTSGRGQPSPFEPGRRRQVLLVHRSRSAPQGREYIAMASQKPSGNGNATFARLPVRPVPCFPRV